MMTGALQKMTDKLWKKCERVVAYVVRGVRNPVALQQKEECRVCQGKGYLYREENECKNCEGTGHERTLADVTSQELKIAAEVKQSKNPPVATIRKALKQAEDGSPDSSYNPVVFIHKTGDSHDNDLMCMTVKTGRKLIPSLRDPSNY